MPYFAALLPEYASRFALFCRAVTPLCHAGFQTHDTPVLLAADDRAELATEKYLPVTPLLEGIVIVRRNPDWIEGTD